MINGEATGIKTFIVTYNNIASIMEQSCVSCHSGQAPSANLKLDSYSHVRNTIESIIDRVNREEGSSGIMPPFGAKLELEYLDLLQEFYSMECE